MDACKPYVILNAAMTLDGKIASKARDSRLSSEMDRKRVHELRSKVDAIMVGINTVMIDDPLLTVRYGSAKPARIIVDSNAIIRRDSRIVKSSKDIRTIIAISEKARDKVDDLINHGLDVIIAGKDRVDLKRLMSILYDYNIKSILLEGGGELNWSMLSNKLVDEVIVTIEPVIIGGRDAVTLVEGDGFNLIEEGIRLNLQDITRMDGEVVLRYTII